MNRPGAARNDAAAAQAEIGALRAEAERHAAAGDAGPAIRAYVRITQLAPRDRDAWLALGNLFRETVKPEAALAALHRALALAPGDTAVQTEIGLTQKLMGRQHEALVTLEDVLARDPGNLYAAFGRAELLLRMNRTDEALPAFDAIVEGERDANHIRAISRWLRGVARLTLGDYPGAWADYEARIHHPTTTFPELVGERWTGQPLAGRTIFLAYEQRFGDVIQFCRFVPDLVRAGARVILQVPAQLVRLFRSLGPGIELVTLKDTLPPYDYCQLVTSIPAILNLPRDAVWRGPYLAIDPGVERRTLAKRPDTSLKVGLVWAGKPLPDRSIPLACYTPLLRHPKVSFYSFQLGEASQQLRELRVGWLITDLAGEIRDFHDSAALMAQMDLIITIDTAAAHQAGALGQPTWLMLIHYSDWRWGAYGDPGTAWYPSLRLFRQHAHGSWEAAAAELDAAFADWVRNAAPGNAP